jgi:hypothetical protein
MRRKIKVKIWNKIYRIWELTLGWYYLSLTDIEQFIEDIFLEFNKNIPVLDEDQTKVIIEKLFNIEDLEIKTLFEKKKDNTDLLKDFHIKVWFFMKFFWNSYKQTMETPLEIFNNLLEDIKIIAWEEKYDPKRKDNKVEKRKLKNLISNLK